MRYIRSGVGEGFMPSLKECSTYFSNRFDHLSAVGTFFRKGIKPFPALAECVRGSFGCRENVNYKKR